MNTFQIIGNIGRIEVKTDGVKRAHINVATTDRWQGQDGLMEKTDWNRITVFGELVETVGKLAKGDFVKFTGKIQPRSYEQDGAKKYTVDLIAMKVVVIASHATSTEEVAA